MCDLVTLVAWHSPGLRLSFQHCHQCECLSLPIVFDDDRRRESPSKSCDVTLTSLGRVTTIEKTTYMEKREMWPHPSKF